MLRYLTVFALLAVVSPTDAASGDFLVHEWGTFTSLQDEAGRTIGGINTDDEPVPRFVHNLAWELLVGDARAQEGNRLVQGWPHAHPDVTMRLETPVLYVHAGDSCDVKLDVEVEFRGGWLTQFYPDATAVGPDRANIKIGPDTRGRLTWNDLAMRHDNPAGPQTDAHVWTTPRNVDATMLSTPKGETEKYLFYRGVGHVESPIRIIRSGTDGRFIIVQDNRPAAELKRPMKVPGLWLTDFREDGAAAFRKLDVVPSSPFAKPPAYEATFAAADYAAENVSKLRASMKAALIADGLYADEAEAMLETWKLSYFKSWGTRVFYIVPKEWTERVLPLRVSPEPSEVVRVMVGRIDLVTPRHRELLAKLTSAQVASSADAVKQHAELWKVYDQLGRFRNALVLEEQRRQFSRPLFHFMAANGLYDAGADLRRLEQEAGLAAPP